MKILKNIKFEFDMRICACTLADHLNFLFDILKVCYFIISNSSATCLIYIVKQKSKNDEDDKVLSE